MNENKDILLDIRDLSVQFNTDSGVVKAVNHLYLRLERGRSLGFVGETGAGKTTTALSILQLVQTPPGEITSGEILFNGQDVRRMTDAEKRRLRGGDVSMIFQDPMTSLNPIMTVEEQITEMVQLQKTKKEFKGHLTLVVFPFLKMSRKSPEHFVMIRPRPTIKADRANPIRFFPEGDDTVLFTEPLFSATYIHQRLLIF